MQEQEHRPSDESTDQLRPSSATSGSSDSCSSCANSFPPAPEGAPQSPPSAGQKAPVQMTQSAMLASIVAAATKEDLLLLVAQNLADMDLINQVTCVHRLAKVFFKLAPEPVRCAWRQELLSSPEFTWLLCRIHEQLVEFQHDMLTGCAAKSMQACTSDLLWALVRLEVADACPDFTLGHQVVQASLPLIEGHLLTTSGQGLASLLWALAKMADPPLRIMMAVLQRFIDLLADAQAPPSSEFASFDAQALSTSVGAIAHVQVHPANMGMGEKVKVLDNVAGRPGCVMAFLEAVAWKTSCVLCSTKSARLRSFMPTPGRLLEHTRAVEQNFSAQALVNLAWNYAAILGEGCKANPTIYAMFFNIRQEAICRMHVVSHALKEQLASPISSYLNEQALSNLVSAYTKANMIDMDKYMLLQEVFNLEAFRVEQLGIWLQSGSQFIFRPQEMCALLRACCTRKAQPYKFLSNLLKLVQKHPIVIAHWSESEQREMGRAFAVLREFTSEIEQKVAESQQQQRRRMWQQQQQQQQQQQRQKQAWQQQLQQQLQQEQWQKQAWQQLQLMLLLLQEEQGLSVEEAFLLSSLPQQATQSFLPDLVASSNSMAASSGSMAAFSSSMGAFSSTTANRSMAPSSMAASSSMAMGLGQGPWQAGAGTLFAGEGAGLGGYTDLDAGLLGLYSTAAQTPTTSLPVAQQQQQQQQHGQGSLGTLLQAQLLAQQDVLLHDLGAFQPADVSGTDPAGQLSAVSQGGKRGASRASFEEPSSDELSELAAVQSELLVLHLDSLVHSQPGQREHQLPADALPQELF